MKLLDFYGIETLPNEFKAFTVSNSKDYFDKSQTSDIIYGLLNDFDPKLFNEMIIENLDLYCEKYIPKYLSAFGNSELDHGKLFFGIDDNGEISGIPFLGNQHLLEINIRKSIKTIEKFIQSKNNDIIINNIKFKIHKLEIDPLILDDVNAKEIVESKIKHYNEQLKLWNIYILKKKVWLERILHVNCSILNYLKDDHLKKLLIQYINENCKHKSDFVYNIVNNKYKIIYDDIHINARKPEKIEYWMAECKDYHSKLLLNLKPKKVMRPYIHFNPYEHELNMLHNLTTTFIEKIPYINYYVIEFILPTKIYNIKYRTNIESKWIKNIRDIKGDTPYCRFVDL